MPAFTEKTATGIKITYFEDSGKIRARREYAIPWGIFVAANMKYICCKFDNGFVIYDLAMKVITKWVTDIDLYTVQIDENYFVIHGFDVNTRYYSFEDGTWTTMPYSCQASQLMAPNILVIAACGEALLYDLETETVIKRAPIPADECLEAYANPYVDKDFIPRVCCLKCKNALSTDGEYKMAGWIVYKHNPETKLVTLYVHMNQVCKPILEAFVDDVTTLNQGFLRLTPGVPMKKNPDLMSHFTIITEELYVLMMVR